MINQYKEDTFVFKYFAPTKSKCAIGTCEHTSVNGKNIYHNFSTNRSTGLAVMIGDDYRKYFEVGKTYIVSGNLHQPIDKNFVIINPWNIERINDVENIFKLGDDDDESGWDLPFDEDDTY